MNTIQCTGSEPPLRCNLCKIALETVDNFNNISRANYTYNAAKQLNKEAPLCKLCNVHCPNEFSLLQHERGKQHTKRVAAGNKHAGSNSIYRQGRGANDEDLTSDTKSIKPKFRRQINQTQPSSLSPASNPNSDVQLFYCKLCKNECKTDKLLQRHLNTKKHLKNEARFCKLCNVQFVNERSMLQHERGKKHKRKAAASKGDKAVTSQKKHVVPRESIVSDVYFKNAFAEPAEDEYEEEWWAWWIGQEEEKEMMGTDEILYEERCGIRYHHGQGKREKMRRFRKKKADWEIDEG